MRRIGIAWFEVATLGCAILVGQSAAGQGNPPARRAAALARVDPKFRVAEGDLRTPVTVIAYGDIRFTDPSNITATSPAARKALIARIAEEQPDAVLVTGDVPWHGGNPDDYSVYAEETRAWRDAHLRIFPALGNHEFSHCEPQQCLANWWQAFPELKGVRWYSVQLGAKICAIALDSDDSLLPGGEQARWLGAQLGFMPPAIEFVLILLHHPPVADKQSTLFSDHNPRPNEIALANFLRGIARKSAAKLIVIAGHVHNYERFEQDGVTYIVSGGGGAVPYPVERMPSDKYQDSSFPNFHYVKFVLSGNALKGTMVRLAHPDGAEWEVKDTFEVQAN
jgi:hypothetical protein